MFGLGGAHYKLTVWKGVLGIYNHFSSNILGILLPRTPTQSSVRPPAHASASPPPTQRAACSLQLGGDFILGPDRSGSFDGLPTADVCLLID